jgi:2-methylaconitate cis-trans-isomerase PrpF
VERGDHDVSGVPGSGLASCRPGALVRESARPDARNRIALRIGHPAGVVETAGGIEQRADGAIRRRGATLGRPARGVPDGTVFVPEAR